MTDKELREMGVEDEGVRKNILEALEKEKDGKLQEDYDKAVAELAAVKKQAALEKEILAAGGKNLKAILALIDMEEVTMDEKGSLKGLDLAAVKEEAPYLFHEKEEKKTGTGVTRSSQKKKEDDIRNAFWGRR